MNSEYVKPKFEVIFFSAEDVFTNDTGSPTPGTDEGEFELENSNSAVNPASDG